MKATEYTKLDELPVEAKYLESTALFDRWAIGHEAIVWVCADCGAIVDSIECGCDACGCGVEQEPEAEAAEWLN